MAFWKLVENSHKPSEGEPFSNEERRRAQHLISNYMKAYGKDCLGMGATVMRASITDDMVVVKMGGFLTPEESFVCYGTDGGADEVRRMRLTVMKTMIEQRTLIDKIEEIVKAKVMYCTVSLHPVDQLCVFVFIVDRTLFD